MAKLIAGLGRRAQFLLLGAVCISGVLAACVLALSGSNTFPSLGELLFAQPVPVTERLYSGATDPQTGAPLVPYDQGTDVMGTNGVPVVRHLTYKDGSLEVIELQADGVLPRESRLYYPNTDTPDLLRLHKHSLYAADGEDIVEQTIYRDSGSRKEHTTMKIESRGKPLGVKIHFLTRKWKTVDSFAFDGKTVVAHEEWFKDEFGELELVKAERWLDDAGRTLIYKEELVDKVRKMTEFDGRGMVMKHTEVNQYRHATVKAYYPGGLALRLEGKSDYYQNKVDFFGPDGRRELSYEIGPSSVDVLHYDAEGTKVRWKQMWWHEAQGFTPGTQMLGHLAYVHEYNEAGEETRVIWFSDGRIKDDTRKNYTENGVTYAWVQRNYDNDGFLKNVEYYREARKNPVTRVVNHTPAEKILPEIDPVLLVKPALEPGLIIPVTQSGYP